MEISILLLTYNHERFIRQALDSIMMQKINVPFEIIILDDASTDGTQRILKEYKKRHPRIISLYLRKTNSNHPTRNVYFLLSKAKGKYWAIIEGDDYWIDKLKIQKQYDFLEQHQRYSGCVTDLIVVDENGDRIKKKVYEKKDDKIYTLEDFRCLRATGRMISFFGRNYFDREAYRVIYKADKVMGDVTINMLCLLKGDIYQLDEAMAAYRYVCASGKGNFNSIHRENIYKEYMLTGYWIQLENFMRCHDRTFEFVPMDDAIRKLSRQYSMKSALCLINKSVKRGKYFEVYWMDKYFQTSDYLHDSRKSSHSPQYNWNVFRREKKAVILFGAGAVAEEYLDKYAWQGNILFLVDNDEGKQDTSLKGFLIKKPEELIRYKDKAKILIVNQRYEADIEGQLRRMGIKDYYCYCSMQTNRLRNIIAVKLLGAGKKGQELF